jgi:hypothetical protein
MSDWVRVATFEGDENALNELVSSINAEPGPPEGVPAKHIMVATDHAGTIRVVIRFGSEEDLETGSATLDGMSPPEDAPIRRVSVEKFEIVLERSA